MARVRVGRRPDGLALDDLQELVAVVAEQARDVPFGVLAARMVEQRAHLVVGHRLGRAAGIDDFQQSRLRLGAHVGRGRQEAHPVAIVRTEPGLPFGKAGRSGTRFLDQIRA
jgi:hypothetical protein